jgi:hypothetical protein
MIPKSRTFYDVENVLLCFTFGLKYEISNNFSSLKYVMYVYNMKNSLLWDDTV